MASVKMSKSDSKGKMISKKPEPIEVELPWEEDEPTHDLNQCSVFLGGEPGIGKTTLAQQAKLVLNLTFDPRRKSIKGVIQRFVPDWRHLMAWLDALEKQSTKKRFYTRVVIDGADMFFRKCQKWACKKLAISHPSDEDWGKGWDLVRETFTDAVDRLLALPCGVWFLGHTKDREMEKRRNRKVSRLCPVLTATCEEILIGKVDAQFTMHYEDDQRIMTVRGDDRIAAKCDIDDHFLTTSGEQIQDFVLGNRGPAKAYERLLAAYNNEVKYASYDAMQEAKSSKEKKEKGGNRKDKDD
jgi:hypothetical protein